MVYFIEIDQDYDGLREARKNIVIDQLKRKNQLRNWIFTAYSINY